MDIADASEEDGNLVLEDSSEIEDDEQSDEQEGGYEELQSAGLPDLVVLEVTFDPNPVVSGQPFAANYIIQNQGDASVGAFTLLWKFHAATGIGVCSWDYDSLDAGETASGSCSKTTIAPTGQSPSTLTVDVEGEIVESDEENNQLAPVLVVAAEEGDDGGAQAGALPDYYPYSIELISDSSIRCDVKNLGSGNAPAGASVKLYISGIDVGIDEALGAISPGDSASVLFAGLEISPDREHQVQCVINAATSFPEIENDESNSYYGYVFVDGGGDALPDLKIGALGTAITQGSREYLCEVKNIGTAPAPAGARVALFVDGTRLTWAETSQVLHIAQYESIRFHNTGVEDFTEFRCVVDGGNKIQELNEENNESSLSR